MSAELVELSVAEYHADPADTPSLSSSMAHLLWSQSPAHAWTAHPRLNPDYEREVHDRFDVGTVAHALFLEGDANLVVVDAPDWRTKAAKDARDEARAEGKTALLAHSLASVQGMIAALHRQLEAHGADPPLFQDGKPEQAIVWSEHGVECRARLDWLRNDHTAIDDYKTTTRSANPESWTRSLYGMGSDVQAAFYIRAVRALSGQTPVFRWCVQETSPPYALSVISPGADVLTIGEKKVEYALALWKRCLDSDTWPGYAPDVHLAQLPAWEEARVLAVEEQAA